MTQVFEMDVKRLEEIVNVLNSDRISLQEGLELLEEGVGLVKKCNLQLEKGRGKLQMLLEGDKGVAVWDAQELEGDF